MRSTAPLLAAIAVLAFVAASNAWFGLNAVRYPHALDHGEGMVLNDAVQLARGESPYRSFDDYPLVLGNYPPLYPLLNAAVIRAGGFSPAFGRGVSLLSLWGGAVLVFLLARRLGHDPVSAALGALWIVTIPMTTSWWVQARVDPLAAVLSLGGLFWLLTRGSRAVVLPAALFAAALATKQSSIFAPAAACVWLATHDRPAAVRLAAWTAAFTAGWLVASVAAFGPDFLLNLGPFTATAPWSIDTLARMLKHTDFASTFLFALLATLYLVIRFPSSGRRERLVTIYVLVTLAGVPLLGKEGSSWLYLVEAAFAGGLAIACATGSATKRGRRGSTAIAAAVTVTIAALALLHVPITSSPSTPRWLAHAARSWTADWEARGRSEARIVEFFRTVDGPVLAEEAFYLLATDRPVLLNPFMARWMAEAGRWDPAPLLRDIEGGKFSVIQLGGFAGEPRDRSMTPAEIAPFHITRSRFPADVLAAVERVYRIPPELAGLAAPKLYVPRSESQ